MSIHPSLGGKGKLRKQKSVLKRTERLRWLMEKGQWKEGDNVFGLPKIKVVKIKIKKEKAEKAAEAAAAGQEAATSGEATAKTAAKEEKK